MNKKIQKAIIEKNMTQKELADKLHVSPQAVSKWISGESSPSSENLFKIEEILEISLSSFRGKYIRKDDSISINIEEINTGEKATKEVDVILSEFGIDKNYSHSVYMLCKWLLQAVFGLKYYKMLEYKRKKYDKFLEYNTVFNWLNEYFEKEVPNNNGDDECYDNHLEYWFEKMWVDHIDAHELYKPDEEKNIYYTLNYWWRFKNAFVKDTASSVFAEFQVALSEIIEGIK